MHIDLTPANALQLVQEANDQGIAHSFTGIAPTGPDAMTLQWEPDWSGPELRVTLHADGTWTALYLNAPSPASR